jgi:hypothetical protein
MLSTRSCDKCDSDHRFRLFIYFQQTIRYFSHFLKKEGKENRMEYSDVCRSFLPLLLLVGGGWNLLMLLREQQPVVLIWFRGIICAGLGGSVSKYVFPSSCSHDQLIFMCQKDWLERKERASCFCVIHKLERNKDQKVSPGGTIFDYGPFGAVHFYYFF